MIGCGFVFVFRYFRVRLQNLKAHRELQKALRQRRRQRALTMLSQAEEAAEQHDARRLYGIVRLLCPNKTRQRIRLRDAEGNLMNGESECKALVQYATKLFSASAEPRMQLLPLEEDIFALPRWRRAMARLKPEKAAPNMTPPFRNWKQHSEKILPQLQKLATHHLCCDHPEIPTEWTEVRLAWLAKPTKCPSSPANVRTVMSGDTKLFNMVLKEAVQEYVTPGLIDIPQFAYRKLSSTVDALLRGSLHCSKVGAMLGEVNTDVTTRLTTDQLGGVMISLDLAKAFDCLPFREMYDSLRCIDVVVGSHRQSICIVRHAGHSAKTEMLRGLRQGCPLAPSVFNAWTIRLCRELGIAWCQEHASLFADDVHGHWEINSVEEFQQARCMIPNIIAGLHRSGMQVNFGRSVAVLAIRGKAAAGIKKRYVKWRDGHYVIAIGTDSVTGREVYLPIEDKMEYLGVILSYGADCAISRGQSLEQFLKTQADAENHLRFQHQAEASHLQSMCCSRLLYGVVGVGFSAPSLRAMQSILARMLRKVLRIYEHGISNLAVLDRAGIHLVGDLRQQLARKARALEVHGHQSPELAGRTLQRLGSVSDELSRIKHIPVSSLIEVDREGETAVCDACGLEFHNQRSLEAHYTTKRAEIHTKARQAFDRREHTLFGLPQCRLCRQQLYDWASMERHITEGRCARLKQAAARGHSMEQLMQQVLEDESQVPPKPPNSACGSAPTPSLIPADVMSCELRQLATHAEVVASFKNKCILCGQQVKATGHIKKHWQSSHPGRRISSQKLAGYLYEAMSILW